MPAAAAGSRPDTLLAHRAYTTGPIRTELRRPASTQSCELNGELFPPETAQQIVLGEPRILGFGRLGEVGPRAIVGVAVFHHECSDRANAFLTGSFVDVLNESPRREVFDPETARFFAHQRSTSVISNE